MLSETYRRALRYSSLPMFVESAVRRHSATLAALFNLTPAYPQNATSSRARPMGSS
jgi:hypothetical protein